MSDIRMDNTNDAVIVNNELVLTDGLESREQHLTIRLQTFLGEWVLDTTIGVAYMQELYAKKNPDPFVIQSVFRDIVEDTPGITEMSSFSHTIDAATRLLTITLSAISVDGEFEITIKQGV